MQLQLTFALLLGGLAACQHTPPAPPNPQLQLKQVRDSYFLHPYDPSTVDAYARQLEAEGDTATALLLYERAVRFAPDRQDLLQRRDAAAQRLAGAPVTPPEASPSPAFAASLAQVMLLTWKRDGGSTSTSRSSSSKHQCEARNPVLTAIRS